MVNEVIKAITERYSCRDFLPAPLDDGQIEILVNAALASPSAMNLQPWHIIVVTEKFLIETMDAAVMEHVKKDAEWYERMKERGGKAFYNAPCMIVIAKDGTEAATLDCGIVSQNIALAAHSLGLGSVICGMARYALESEKGAEFIKRMKFPDGYGFGMSVCVGRIKSGKAPHDIDTEKVTYIR